jgi:hypothetical protein
MNSFDFVFNISISSDRMEARIEAFQLEPCWAQSISTI